MKLNFALNLTDDRISLLHRSGQNWNDIGSADFGADDMDARLADMLAAATAKAPKGVATKIVIPNSQILYTVVSVTGGTDAARRAEIKAALAGRTPYAVDDLVFDYAGDGPEVQVAVVAQETLDQAEDFAVGYKFRPVGFVGIPAAEDFAGEPHFGLTKFAPTVLGKGRRLEWDTAPVAWADMTKGVEDASPVAVDAFPEAETSTRVWSEDDVVAERRAEPAPEPYVPEPYVPEPPAPMPEPKVLADMPVPQPVDTAPPELAMPEPAVDVPQPVVPAPEPEPVPATPRFAGVADPSVPEVDEAPFAEVADTDTAASADDDMPPAPSTAALMAFASRRATAAGTASPVEKPPVEKTMPPAPIADRMAARAQVNMRPEPRVTISPAGTAPMVGSSVGSSGKKQRKAVTTAAVAPTASTTIPPSAPRKPLTKPGGTFGSTAPVRGKPRFLGLILTGILILFLALLAAWSSFFLASQTDPGAEPATAVAADDAPDPTDEALADGQEPELALPDAQADGVVLPDTAATDTALPDVAVSDTDIAAGPEPAVEPQAAPDADSAAIEPAGPAPETGVVTTGPAPVAPDAEADEILLSTADSPLALQEAANLAAPELQGDAVPTAQMAPPPFGTVYEFNANGTVRAVPEGIMTPDGVRLVAGAPARVPPARPAAIAAAAVAVAAPVTPPGATDTAVVDDTTVVGSDPALADARPRARPAGLVVPNPDDAALQTDGPVLASSPRPPRRPDSVTAAGAAVDLAAEDAARATDAASLAAASAAAGTAAEAIIQDLAVTAPETAALTPSGSRLAVSVSRIPAPRPRDMERAVAAALEAATRAPAPEPEPEPEPQQVAAATPEQEPEPEVEAPVASAPTSGSVADRATFVNAINLSEINLIGVYGSESNRYALIRQSNGRYKKVTVGDRVDGGVVQAITSNEVRYQKGGRLLALQMPDT